MAYSDRVKEFARECYNDGVSCARISERVNAEFGLTTTPRTVERWSESKRLRWKERREEIRARVETDRDRAAARSLEARLEEVELLLDAAGKKIRSAGDDVDPQTIYAYQALLKARAELKPYAEERTNIEELVQRLFRVLKGHPKLGPMLDRHADEVLELLRRDLGKK